MLRCRLKENKERVLFFCSCKINSIATCFGRELRTVKLSETLSISRWGPKLFRPYTSLSHNGVLAGPLCGVSDPLIHSSVKGALFEPGWRERVVALSAANKSPAAPQSGGSFRNKEIPKIEKMAVACGSYTLTYYYRKLTIIYNVLIYVSNY